MGMRAERLLSGLDETRHQKLTAWEALEEQVAVVVEDARVAWGGVLEIDEVGFVTYLTDRLPRHGEPRASFAGLRAADLYLAYRCATGDALAVAAFEQVYGGELTRIARRIARPPHAPEDLEQQLREKLFVDHGSSGRPPKIADYRGQGVLQNWLRVTAVRSCLDAVRPSGIDRQESMSLDEELSATLASDSEDLDLAFLKREYRAEFRRAFAEAVNSLAAAERNLLRQHVVDELTIDQIAALHGVHRSTAARRLTRARSDLASRCRRTLMEALQINRSELDSIMRLIQSQLDFSVHQLLR